MRILPTEPAGLVLEVESADEWPMLTGILRDARLAGFDPANHVSGPMRAGDAGGDWEEFVLPELREGFEEHLRTVLKALEDARYKSGGGPASVRIPHGAMFHWYAALNQARLALENRYRFTTGIQENPENGPAAERRSAYYRSQFYCALQCHLLDHGIDG